MGVCALWRSQRSELATGCLNPITSAGRTSVDIWASAKLELVDKFCYLGDMLSVDGCLLYTSPSPRDS